MSDNKQREISYNDIAVIKKWVGDTFVHYVKIDDAEIVSTLLSVEDNKTATATLSDKLFNKLMKCDAIVLTTEQLGLGSYQDYYFTAVADDNSGIKQFHTTLSLANDSDSDGELSSDEVNTYEWFINLDGNDKSISIYRRLLIDNTEYTDLEHRVELLEGGSSLAHKGLAGDGLTFDYDEGKLNVDIATIDEMDAYIFGDDDTTSE